MSEQTKENGDIELGVCVSCKGSLAHKEGDCSVQASTADLLDEKAQSPEADDPWAITETVETGPTWGDLTKKEKIKRVVFTILRVLAIIACLLFFVCSLDFLQSAFQLLGGRAAGAAFRNSAVLANPFAGLVLGIITTAVLQSSSTSTSIVITMVSAGLMTVKTAVPVVMGSNIGTSVTGIIVSITQSGDRNTFRRAFAAATLHDMFNWSTVILLLPLEIASGYLEKLTGALVKSMKLEGGDGKRQEFLKVITRPFTELVVMLDTVVLDGIATGDKALSALPMLRQCCKYEGDPAFFIDSEDHTYSAPFPALGGVQPMALYDTGDSEVFVEDFIKRYNRTCLEKCRYMFVNMKDNEPLAGALLLIMSLAILITCLLLMVKNLRALLQGSLASVVKKTINSDFPGIFACLTGYVAILVGAVSTVLVQSSSIFTSTMTPLVGIGVVTIERVYPMFCGTNIGTTSTGFIAAFAASSLRISAALQIAFCHLFFNISGILIFYPIPFMRIPIPMAKKFGNVTSQYRWFAILYLISMFFLFPLSIFGLSMGGWPVLAGVMGPILLLVIIIAVINILQAKKPQILPAKLQSWEFLPLWMHSLDPLDRQVSKVMGACKCCKCCKKEPKEGADDEYVKWDDFDEAKFCDACVKRIQAKRLSQIPQKDQLHTINGNVGGIENNETKEIILLPALAADNITTLTANSRAPSSDSVYKATSL